ncbi:MAG: flagellar export chaperone FliS [Eubacteriales bacterium]|nr:flagellar export chaperone FliS [Bacillota bacterium]MBV1770467.1 flagellar export chaperone FliS [Desulforudis sp.]MDP3044542.1 flagellar export chaperone FliS [Bacillota bacterium]MDZ4042032.1 flagellar export chaperone FliS [Eubacteriales bacterium]MDZ7609158.1 flagellar export chaperone FliS [Eubacteriales bacterium]
MAANNPYAQYQQNAILNAKPEQLVTLLYNGAVKYTKQADMALEKKDLQAAHNAMVQVQNIITYLQATLNMDYEVSEQLDSLYGYIYDQLLQANLKKDPAILAQVLKIIEELRDTWTEALTKQAGGVQAGVGEADGGTNAG